MSHAKTDAGERVTPNTQAADNRIVAVRLASAGAAILLVGPDKRPLTVRWREKSITDRQRINAGFQRRRNAIPAIDCGKTGLLVIDADVRNSRDGVATFEALAKRIGVDLTLVPIIATPSGGRHYIFANRKERRLGNRRGGLPAGIDVRGDGGYIVAPGSVLPGDRIYQQIAGPDFLQALSDAALPPIPPALAEIIEGQRPAAEVVEASVAKFKRKVIADSEEKNGPARGRQAATKALLEEADRAESSSAGMRNNQLNASAFRLARFAAAGWLAPKRIEDAMLRASQVNGLIDDDGIASVKATLASAISAGLEKGAVKMRERPRVVGTAIEAGQGPKFAWHQSLVESCPLRSTLLVAGHVLHRFDVSTGSVALGSRTVARSVGINRKTAQIAIDTLETDGWLLRLPVEPGQVARFTLAVPPSRDPRTATKD